MAIFHAGKYTRTAAGAMLLMSFRVITIPNDDPFKIFNHISSSWISEVMEYINVLMPCSFLYQIRLSFVQTSIITVLLSFLTYSYLLIILILHVIINILYFIVFYCLFYIVYAYACFILFSVCFLCLSASSLHLLVFFSVYFIVSCCFFISCR